MRKGKFIVLEGLDGSGKSTQTQLLLNALLNKGIRAEYIHFPRTDASSPFYGPMLKRFLKGELGTLQEVDPFFVAMLFAGDRRNESERIKSLLHQGVWIVADRFVLSNIAFQGAKLPSQEEQIALARWILHTEFDVFDLPRPDLTLFLHMPFSFCKLNVEAQRNGSDRDYLDGKADIHEADNRFQEEVYKMYRYMLSDPLFQLRELRLADDVQVPPPAEIHEKLMNFLTW